MIRQVHWLITTTTTDLLVGQDIADHRIETDVFSNAGGHHTKVISKFSKCFHALPSRKIGYSVRRSFPDRVCTTARATSAPRYSPWLVTSRTRLWTSCRRVVMVSPQAFTASVVVAAASWGVWICDSRAGEKAHKRKSRRNRCCSRKDIINRKLTC